MAEKRVNDKGNIRKRSNGRWEGQYIVGYHPDTDKRIIKNVLDGTQIEVKAKLKKAIEEAGSLGMVKVGKYTVAEWLRLRFEVYAKPDLRFSTAEYYRRGTELYTIPYIGEVKLNQLATRQIQNLYRELQQSGRHRAAQKNKHPGLSGSATRGAHIMLHSALDRAVKEELFPYNSAEDCVVLRLQWQEMKTLEPEDTRAYLETAERRGILVLLYLELVSGIRKGELAALLWSGLDAEYGTTSVSKQVGRDAQGELTVCQSKTSNSVREISIPQEAVGLLMQKYQRHPESHYLLPFSRTDGMYHPGSIVNFHKKILKDAGLEYIRLYNLHHTFVTVALQSGVNIRTVSAMLSHYGAGFTLRTYTHTNRRVQEKVAEKIGNFVVQVLQHRTVERAGEDENPLRSSPVISAYGSRCGSKPDPHSDPHRIPAKSDKTGGNRPIPAGFWSWKRDLNTRPADYELAVLPTELFQYMFVTGSIG